MQRRIGQSFCNMREACSLVWSVLVLLFRSRVSLEAEILILRHQLNIQRRHVPKRVAFSAIDRLIFVGLYRLVPTTIKALTIESPIPSSVGTVPVSDRIGAGNPGVAAAARLFCCQLAARTPNLWIGEISVLVLRDEPMERCGRSWFECPLWQAAGAASVPAQSDRLSAWLRTCNRRSASAGWSDYGASWVVVTPGPSLSCRHASSRAAAVPVTRSLSP